MTPQTQHEEQNRGTVARNARFQSRAARVRAAKDAIANLDRGDLSPEEARRWNEDINSKVGGVHDIS